MRNDAVPRRSRLQITIPGEGLSQVRVFTTVTDAINFDSFDLGQIGIACTKLSYSTKSFKDHRFIGSNSRVAIVPNCNVVLTGDTEFISPHVPERCCGPLAGDTVGTERKLAETQQRDVERREKDFLAILAHELRSPLASLQNGLAILDASDSADLSVKTRALMRRQVVRMNRLIDDLMDVSRIASGKVQLKIARVSLKTIIDEAVESSLTAINGAGHTVNIDIPGDAIVNADSTHLSQVFCNLLNNAAKYTPRGGHIKVTAEKQECTVTVRVTDDGDGMEPRALSSVFEMYDQAGSTVDHAQGGLGIGLAIAKNLTAMHGGSIHAESPGLGKGSTFVVQLPLVTTVC